MKENKRLVIVFVKNTGSKTVKTRLAKTIGAQKAKEVYSELLDITKQEIALVLAEKWVYFSHAIDALGWKVDDCSVQEGEDLGEKMSNAFKDAFEQGFEHVVLIGSDLPELSSSLIHSAFDALQDSDVVLGPADDGGYYLIGMSNMNYSLFENKPWSQGHLMEETLMELEKKELSVSQLQSLNDIDTYDDYRRSKLYKQKLDPASYP